MISSTHDDEKQHYLGISVDGNSGQIGRSSILKIDEEGSVECPGCYCTTQYIPKTYVIHFQAPHVIEGKILLKNMWCCSPSCISFIIKCIVKDCIGLHHIEWTRVKNKKYLVCSGQATCNYDGEYDATVYYSDDDVEVDVIVKNVCFEYIKCVQFIIMRQIKDKVLVS